MNFPSPVATSARSKNNPGGGTLKVRQFQKEIVVTSILLKNTEKKSPIYALKVSKFQNEFMKSSFLRKYEPYIVRISAMYCATLQDRNPYNFWFIFWEK